MLGVIGILAAIAILIWLSIKGVNVFVVAMIASVVVIVTNGMDFWPAFTQSFADGFKNFCGNFFLLFGLAAAYGEFMKVTGSAESVADKLFKMFGAKWAPVVCLLVTLLMAMGGISAFVIVFAVYPIAAPLFRKANISKTFMPAIFLGASVSLCLALPGNPTSTNALLTREEYGLGVDAYSAPVMGIIACIVGAVLCSIYLIMKQRKYARLGIGYATLVAEGSKEDEETEKKLPPFWSSILPIIVVIVMMFLLKKTMGTTECILTSLLVAMGLSVLLNPKTFFGKGNAAENADAKDKKNGRQSIIKTFANGFWSSVPAIMLTGAVMGFAGVVQAAGGFQVFLDFANGLSNTFNPYVSGVFAVNIMSGITGTALGGLQFFANSMLPNYIGHVDPAAFHRLMTIACCGLDTLPHCSTFITCCAVCGVTVKTSYKHVFAITIVVPLIMTAVCLLCISAGII